MKIATQLALAELRHDWRAALCFIAALVGVLVPLLLLLALKNGLIGAMVDRLVEDPRNRQLIAIGSGAYPPAFFQELQERADVAFIMPATRSINTQADAVRSPSNRKLERGVQLIPSKPGDPLIAQGAVAPGIAFITDALAKQLEVGINDDIQLVIERELDGQLQSVRLSQIIRGIIPAERFGTSAVFIDLSHLLDIEAFRDDRQLSPANWQNARPDPETFASFRLYAQSLNDLTTLQNHLKDQGVRSRPRAENTALLLGIRRNLNLLYAVIAILASLGFWASMAANLRGMIERQRISFSLLTLVGMSLVGRMLIPFTQSITLVISGIFLTLLLLQPVIMVINQIFATDRADVIAFLTPTDLAVLLLLGILTAATACIWAIWALRTIKSDEVLRHA